MADNSVEHPSDWQISYVDLLLTFSRLRFDYVIAIPLPDLTYI